MNRIIIFSVMAAALVVSGCASFGGSETYADLDTYEGLARALEDGANIILYDVRTEEEYVSGHIAGARNVPYDVVQRRVPFWYKNRTVVVYCASGGRSGRAFQTLTDRDFSALTDFGGIGNWQGDLVLGKKRQ